MYQIISIFDFLFYNIYLILFQLFTNMKKTPIGIVGLGRLGREYAKNIAVMVNNAELVAACSLVQAELDYVQQHFDVPNIYTDYEAMLADKSIEAIVIISSTDQHADQIIKALAAGKHVFCEKPLSINIPDCYKVEAAAEKYKDQIAMLGFVRRYDASYADAKRKIDEGLVGKPFFLRSQTIDKDTWAPFQIEYCTTGGGIFHDFNAHDIDLAHWFLGSDIKKVWSLGGAYRFKEFGDLGDADNTFAMCELENGTSALIGASRVSSFGHNTMTEIFATEGNLKVGDPNMKNRLIISDKYGVRSEGLETFFDRFKDAFLTQIQAFVDCVQAGKQPDLTIKNAAKVTLVATALTKSFKEKRVVDVDDLRL